MNDWEIIVRDRNTRSMITRFIPGGPGSVFKLKWTFVREGGCEAFEFALRKDFDSDWGGVVMLADVELLLDGVPRWRGYVDEVVPKVALPETVMVKCKGYYNELESGIVSWPMGRAVLRAIGPTTTQAPYQYGNGEIAGVIAFLLLDFPIFAGVRPTGSNGLPPHPICDAIDIDQSAYRPDSLVYRNDNIKRVIGDLAVLAGNYEWGVDEYRTFYFKSPEAWASNTALLQADHTNGLLGQWWGSQPSQQINALYADDSYSLPDVDGPSLPVNAHAWVGRDVVELNETISMSNMKNSALVYTAPPAATRPVNRDEPISRVTEVSDPASIARYGVRRWVRLDAPGLTSSGDAVRWGTYRLRVLSEARITGTVTIRSGAKIPPRGSIRIIMPPGDPFYLRIAGVSYEYPEKAEDSIITKVDVGIDPPGADSAAKAWRQQATLFYDRTTAEETAFVHLEDEAGTGLDVWPLPSFPLAQGHRQ